MDWFNVKINVPLIVITAVKIIINTPTEISKNDRINCAILENGIDGIPRVQISKNKAITIAGINIFSVKNNINCTIINMNGFHAKIATMPCRRNKIEEITGIKL